MWNIYGQFRLKCPLDRLFANAKKHWLPLAPGYICGNLLKYNATFEGNFHVARIAAEWKPLLPQSP
jgi:hypothetical protein